MYSKDALYKNFYKFLDQIFLLFDVESYLQCANSYTTYYKKNPIPTHTNYTGYPNKFGAFAFVRLS